jgi:hypothetical protein
MSLGSFCSIHESRMMLVEGWDEWMDTRWFLSAYKFYV